MTQPDPTRPYDVVVVGGGILGLATAWTLLGLRPGLRLLVLEKEPDLAAHQTGHNSGVIHAGLYYRPGSAKARLTTEGRSALLRFCDEEGVAYRMCGKVVVAVTEAEVPRLEELLRRGTANGVLGLRRIGPEELREREPFASGVAGLFSPATGIVDFPGMARALARRIVERGGEVRTGAKLTGARPGPGNMLLHTSSGDVAAGFVINCAGLHCDLVARMMGASTRVRIVPFRGEYYHLLPPRDSMVRTLIYPVPDPAFPFLGVHFTRGIHGEVEAGPNAVLAWKREGYRRSDVSVGEMLGMAGFSGFRAVARKHWRMAVGEMWRSMNKAAFVRALQRLMPQLRSEDLRPGGSGVRAQAVLPDGTLLDDFHFEDGPRSLHVLNAPSPAATASLAIAREIARRAAPALGLKLD